jgi:hypothetical protein
MYHPQFLLCSTVLNRKQYTVLPYKIEDNLVEKLNYLLTHRKDAVFWPLFVKSDIKELAPMDQSLPHLLRGLIVGSDACKIRYNGRIYQVEEIKLSNRFKGYWSIISGPNNFHLDPSGIEFV